MLGGDIFRSEERKKRLIAIGFSIYIQIPRASTSPLLRPVSGQLSLFPDTETREEGTYFSTVDLVNLPLDKSHSYLYYSGGTNFVVARSN